MQAIQAPIKPGMGIPVIRASTPLISTIHSKELSVHAQASVNNSKDELHVNFIIESSRLLPTAMAKLTVFDVQDKKVLLNTGENLDALGTKSLFLTRKIHTRENFNDPIRISLNILNNHFVFEFQ